MIKRNAFYLFALVLVTGMTLARVAFAQDTQFVPLTNLPGIQSVAQSSTLPTFLNSLYKLCIGAAAVIAVLQIMRAGMYFMFNKGSVAHNEQAKHLITNSVLGLLLVLSPAIVFGLINPDILNLKLDVSSLQTDPSVPAVSEWLNACNIQTSATGQQCLAAVPTTVKTQYNDCIKGNSSSTCASNARADMKNGIRLCNISVTNDQESCIDQQVNNFVATNLGAQDPGKAEDCNLYDQNAFKSVPRNSDNSATCPAGTQIASDRCCRTTSSYACCGKLATTVYVAAYYVTITKPDGKACTEAVASEYSSKGTVGTIDTKDASSISAGKPCDPAYIESYWTNDTYGIGKPSNPHWLQECTQMPAGTYKLPADKNTCSK